MKPMQWTGHEENAWSLAGSTTSTIHPGIFNIEVTEDMFGNAKWVLRHVKPKHDNIVEIAAAKYMARSIDAFWKARARYQKFGLLHKRGFLLHGMAGCGKSMAAMCAAEYAANHGGLVIAGGYPQHIATVVPAVRTMHPAMPMLVMWEDIDRWCRAGSNNVYRNIMTQMLDGEQQIDNVVHIATTNFFDLLDPAFANRPGRFDDVIEVGAPSLNERLEYLHMIVPKDEANRTVLEEIAKGSEGFMLSHLKDFMTSVMILGRSVNETRDRLAHMISTAPAPEPEEEEE